jgi:hypothetical protein
LNSSIRFKEDVHDMADASSRLFQLRPVTYRYKQAHTDGSKPVDYGLIAEEVGRSTQIWWSGLQASTESD